MESCSIIKDGNGRLVLEVAEVERSWKEYFDDLYNIDAQEQVAVRMYGFDGAWRGNYFGGEPIGRTEFEARLEWKNGNAAGKNEITRKMIKV